MPLPTPEELQAAWEEVQDLHRQYLAIHGVRLPQTEHYTGHNRALQLAVLCHYRHREVHKDEISAVAQRDLEDAAADQQARHLKRDGWYIGPKPGLHKLDPYRVSQEFQNSNARKRKRLAGGDFDSIKQAFSGRRATCGALEGRPDPRYGDDIVKLQQGHRDPHEAGDDPDNIIPQCQFCNRSYRSDFVFDERGRVRAVAGIGGRSNGPVPSCRNAFWTGSNANSGRAYHDEEETCERVQTEGAQANPYRQTGHDVRRSRAGVVLCRQAA